MKLFLYEERKRLKLKAKDVASYAGICETTQSNYETGKRSPDARYLTKIIELGFNLRYVLTGIRDKDTLDKKESLFIELNRKAPQEVQDFILRGLSNSQNTSNYFLT